MIWRRVMRGACAWLAVLLLVCSIGIVRIGASAHSVDSSYDDLTLIVQNDTPSDEVSAAAPLDDDDGANGDKPFHALPVEFAAAFQPSIPVEGQLPFGLRSSAIERTLNPTGPPAAVTL